MTSETTGEPLVPVTETQLRKAGATALRITVPCSRHSQLSAEVQELFDLADWLLGERGDPGSAWPQRAPLISDDEAVRIFTEGWRRGADTMATRFGIITTLQERR